MQKQNVEIEVLVNGKPVREYDHKGNVFIEGRKGTQFSLRLKNNSSSRKLFVPSIDGLSVLNGENASFDSSGYIVNGYSSITIDGWRKSDTHVAQFYFSSPKESYGKRTGKGQNLGIIGCAVFEEKTYTRQNDLLYKGTYGTTDLPFKPYPIFGDGTLDISKYKTVYTSSALCSASAGIGTGWGQEKYSAVTTVTFERSGSPTVLEIQYNTRENLAKLGIRFNKDLQVAPQAFPSQYCKPPRQ
jgi:hypothetical protein